MKILSKFVLLLTLALALPAQAQRTTVGYFQDIRGVLTPDPQNQVIGGSESTFTHLYCLDYNAGTAAYPFWTPILPVVIYNGQNHHYGLYGISDNITWYSGGTLYPERVAAVSYLTDGIDSAGDLLFTTIYGIDNDPTSDQITITGYDAAAPQVTFENEQVTGAGGTVYDASSSEFVRISELGKTLGSDFDLSPFTGDSSTGVYVFQTTIPNSALILQTTPEPGTLSLLLAGSITAVGMLRARRRK